MSTVIVIGHSSYSDGESNDYSRGEVREEHILFTGRWVCTILIGEGSGGFGGCSARD